ncbi:MAG: TetR/AcrR family transcriptional regulator [Phaeovulum sp.]|uniref:TetR/AcrR family transcriptional regulator n=1 Tax=Phaeovulum sp. TaxID=2934796 RepID=UPI00272F8E95|nr:TetR/AcrR family transcriptional regulator [Phaeovulum sp.]MDP2061773.1 TetR/AcrR family transcriptional regulator [Phaeovulum sp.]
MEAADIKRGRKWDQVLQGARGVFLRDGFEGASVDLIAREAGVSKATLYSYFADKRRLFMEVANVECRRQAEAALQLIDPAAAPAVVLRAAAEHIVSFMRSDFGQRIFRICVAEADRFPALGAAFYRSGPMLAREKLGAYLRLATARGELAITDFDLAADQFAELCRAGIHARLIFGIIPAPTPAEIDRTIEGAVETFLARYGADTA